jgi:AcrR family transcriptional regulator
MKPARTDTRRTGRPTSERACEVEPRILDGAAQVFLERGFDGASIELIAETARAGKPTIYARYPDKAALFEAAFLHSLAARNDRLATYHPSGETVEARLASIGAALVEESLDEDFIGLMRLAIAEARRLPEMAENLMRQCRERGGRLVARLLVEGIDETDWTDARALKAGRIFTEAVLLPFLLRALSAEDLSALRLQVAPHVADRVRFFLAGLRNGGVG